MCIADMIIVFVFMALFLCCIKLTGGCWFLILHTHITKMLLCTYHWIIEKEINFNIICKPLWSVCTKQFGYPVWTPHLWDKSTLTTQIRHLPFGWCRPVAHCLLCTTRGSCQWAAQGCTWALAPVNTHTGLYMGSSTCQHRHRVVHGL